MLQAVEEARMGRVRVAGFAVSLDGFGAGPEQSLQDPLGKRGTELHSWFFGTKTFKANTPLERARDAAGARDVKIGGGVSTVRQYLQAGLIDELHFALSPVLLGRGEAMFEGLDLPALGYRVMESTATDLATHVVLGR